VSVFLLSSVNCASVFLQHDLSSVFLQQDLGAALFSVVLTATDEQAALLFVEQHDFFLDFLSLSLSSVLTTILWFVTDANVTADADPTIPAKANNKNIFFMVICFGLFKCSIAKLRIIEAFYLYFNDKKC